MRIDSWSAIGQGFCIKQRGCCRSDRNEGAVRNLRRHQLVTTALRRTYTQLDAGSLVARQSEGLRVDHPESLHHERRCGGRLQANPLALPLDVLPIDLAPALETPISLASVPCIVRGHLIKRNN